MKSTRKTFEITLILSRALQIATAGKLLFLLPLPLQAVDEAVAADVLPILPGIELEVIIFPMLRSNIHHV